MTALSNDYVPRYLGMTPFGQQLEQRLLNLSARSLLSLVNEKLSGGPHDHKWIDADTKYTIVQEVAKRWAGVEAKLWDRVSFYERDDAERPVPPPAVQTDPLVEKTAPTPEIGLAPTSKAPRAPRPVSATGKKRTLKDAFRERFAAGDTDDAAWKTVQAEFALPDSKKGYAKWYRKDLAKESK